MGINCKWTVNKKVSNILRAAGEICIPNPDSLLTLSLYLLHTLVACSNGVLSLPHPWRQQVTWIQKSIHACDGVKHSTFFTHTIKAATLSDSSATVRAVHQTELVKSL